mmetsp:Transcript_28860/g.51427  ORF Transcript_28860/g.51427 Transcript_28860/m.51427 type:complete len:82 (+) Transcript_28860:830-1075(+)
MQGMSEAELQKIMMYEEMRYYNLAISHCFKECVRTMTSKQLLPPEKTCLENCFAKVTKYNERFAQAMNYVNMTRTQISQPT